MATWIQDIHAELRAARPDGRAVDWLRRLGTTCSDGQMQRAGTTIRLVIAANTGITRFRSGYQLFRMQELNRKEAPPCHQKTIWSL
jgi:hypothetical protein